jgi:RluA family pseudouridine synthase
MKLPFSTLYEDDDVIAFDKPTGLLVIPDRWDKEEKNMMGLIHQHISKDIFNVHRLDYETSGVLLCTKNKNALDFLSGQFQARTVKKRYEVITLGSPLEDEFTIDLPIMEDPQNPGKMMAKKKQGKPSETHVRVLTRWRGYSWLEAFPLTGRTHQIRVHLKAVGCPVVADPIYGDGRGLLLSDIKRAYKYNKEGEERPLIGRLALHAESIEVKHPTSKIPMTIHSPQPKTFEVAIKYLKKFAGL